MKSIVLFLALGAIAVFASPTAEKETTPHPAYQKDIEISPLEDSRIINGHAASRDQFPYQVSLNWRWLLTNSHICGGSILAETIVLTAAHCIYDYGTYTIIGGILNRGETTASRQNRDVRSIINHPNWPGGAVVAPNDIAIIHLSAPFTWTSSVQPVGLPFPGTVHAGVATLSGWGRTSSSSSTLPTTLQFVEKELITINQCASALTGIIGNAGPLTDTMLCTSGANRISACNGDSGGPLVKNGMLIGVVSWGLSPCGTVNAPSVFTRTSSFISWIHSQS